MIEPLLIALEAAVLALWAGAMAGFAFIVAPIAIRIVPRMDTFATLIGAIVRGIGSFGSVCGALAIVAALGRAITPAARPLALGRIALVAVGLAASAYESSAIVPKMEATAALIPGPIDSVPKSDPRRAAYDAQHTSSSRIYGLAFLCVLGAVALAPFGRRRRAEA